MQQYVLQRLLLNIPVIFLVITIVFAAGHLRPDYAEQALASSSASNEDYEAGLESSVADVKQCAAAGEADHILAARFLQRFIADTPWLHVDLSSSRCEEGLGIVAGDVTGFGVAWGLAMLHAAR